MGWLVLFFVIHDFRGYKDSLVTVPFTELIPGSIFRSAVVPQKSLLLFQEEIFSVKTSVIDNIITYLKSAIKRINKTGN